MYCGVFSIIANVLGIIGYFPEIYSLIYDVEVKITTKIWCTWILSGLFALTYAICINDAYVIMSSVVGLSFNLIIYSLKTRKIYIISQNVHQEIEQSTNNPIHNSEKNVIKDSESDYDSDSHSSSDLDIL
jgi:uncharacterized membrane-anchored protein YitT (DUF2179 family)